MERNGRGRETDDNPLCVYVPIHSTRGDPKPVHIASEPRKRNSDNPTPPKWKFSTQKKRQKKAAESAAQRFCSYFRAHISCVPSVAAPVSRRFSRLRLPLLAASAVQIPQREEPSKKENPEKIKKFWKKKHR